MIWNNVAERANFTAQMITASGYARMMIASITHWKRIIRMGAWIGLDEMKPNRNYPIMLGMTPPNKQAIGIKSKLGSGYDLYILDEDMTHQYAQLHFCIIEAVDRMIDLLQRMKELWEREENTENE